MPSIHLSFEIEESTIPLPKREGNRFIARAWVVNRNADRPTAIVMETLIFDDGEDNISDLYCKRFEIGIGGRMVEPVFDEDGKGWYLWFASVPSTMATLDMESLTRWFREAFNRKVLQ
jgi:hypothetical protein